VIGMFTKRENIAREANLRERAEDLRKQARRARGEYREYLLVQADEMEDTADEIAGWLRDLQRLEG
jgi:vacuolar-type H+-ATPase subunit H